MDIFIKQLKFRKSENSEKIRSVSTYMLYIAGRIILVFGILGYLKKDMNIK